MQKANYEQEKETKKRRNKVQVISTARLPRDRVSVEDTAIKGVVLDKKQPIK